jgi:hypothetical protein
MISSWIDYVGLLLLLMPESEMSFDMNSSQIPLTSNQFQHQIYNK